MDTNIFEYMLLLLLLGAIYNTVLTFLRMEYIDDDYDDDDDDDSSTIKMDDVSCILSVAIVLSSSLLCDNRLSHLFMCVCVCNMIKKENTMVDYNTEEKQRE